MSWKDISTAPKDLIIGCRGRMILGIDKEGNVYKTFWTEHDKGHAWLITYEGILHEWFPIAWTKLPQWIHKVSGDAVERVR